MNINQHEVTVTSNEKIDCKLHHPFSTLLHFVILSTEGKDNCQA